MVRKISTGQDSTLNTYRGIAYIMDGFMEGKAVEFIDKKIKESSKGKDEVVLADEKQMIRLLHMIANTK